MSRADDLGAHIRIMSNLLKRKVLEVALPPEGGWATAGQGNILGYLHRHQDRPVFQRDLEEAFQIRRSTASRILKRMEEQGLLRRERVEEDARLKRLVLTDKARAMHRHVERSIHQMEDVLSAGLTEEERSAFCAIAAKIEENLS